MEKTIVIMLAFTTLLAASAMARPAFGIRKMVGGKSEIKDVATNKEVQDLGRYCVEEYKRRQQSFNDGEGAAEDRLMFSRVVAGQRQVVAGIKYFLDIEIATPSGSTKMYESVVVVKPWLHPSKQLVAFSPMTGSLF